MSAPSCQQARRGLSAQGEVDDASAAHLAGCVECRTFAEGLDAVRHHAPGLVGPPPPELRGEVLEALGAPASATATRVWRPRAVGSRRTVLSLLAAVGGGVVGLLVVLLLAGPPMPAEDDAAQRLADAATLHAGSGISYRFDMAGDLELRLPSGGVTPGRMRLAEQLEALGRPADLAGGARLEVSFRAQGEADGRGALAYELRWRLQGPSSASGVLDVVSLEGDTVVRADGRRWAGVGEGAGFDLGVATFPHHLGEVLGRLTEAEQAATLDTVELDGAPVDHLRARTADGMVVDAWLGSGDDWLRRLRWIPAPPSDDRDGTTHGEVVVRFHEHGRSRFVGVPEDVADLDDLDEGQRPPLLPGPP